jgi:hypothetical protein
VGGRSPGGGAAFEHGNRDQECRARGGGHDPAHVVGWAWARFADRLSRTPPARTAAGHDMRPVAIASRWSRCRSRAAITQVRSTDTAIGQDIGPCWPCWAAVSRMWVNDPAPAITASSTTGIASSTTVRRRAAITRTPAAASRPVIRAARSVERARLHRRLFQSLALARFHGTCISWSLNWACRTNHHQTSLDLTQPN